MIRYKRKFEKYVNNWLSQNGFECKCVFDNDFFYDVEHEVLHVGLITTESADKYFKEYLMKLGLKNTSCDTFLLSFFHELGHYMTQDDLYDSDWKKAIKIDEYLNSKKEHTKKDFFKYFSCNVEKFASIWAIDFIESNEELVKDFYDGLLPIIRDICKYNSLEEISGGKCYTG